MNIKELIANNRLKEALDVLRDETKDTAFENVVLGLEGSFNNLTEQQRRGTIGFENDNLRSNQFRDNILNINEDWEKEKTFKNTEGTKITFLKGKTQPLEKNIALILEVPGKGNVLEDVKYHFDKEPNVSFIHVAALKKELNNESTDDFESFITDFYELLTSLKTAPKKIRGKQPLLHIFLAIPASLALGCGATFRNLFPFQVYNYDRKTMKYTLNIRSKEVLGK